VEKGFFDESWLMTLNRLGTKLPSHCDMNLTPGIDMTTGSLGQGFSCAVGVALGSKLRGDNATIYSIIGDGESQEGQIWEAAMFAGKEKLNNFIAFTDYNKMQIDGNVDEVCDIAPLDKKWEAFNFNTIVVKDGHDMAEISQAIDAAKQCKDKPSMIILNTIKGKGVSFIEQMKSANHNTKISAEQLAVALAEIKGE
ncbi:MAG: 1-deoxy-D-xylulose-5-phosphate synthase N-terminal domain-containing protein, partial [Clostridia bacterium]